MLDTSVLLSDPRALRSFAHHDVVLPLVVLTELEAKRHHPELGWAARATLRDLEDLRVKHRSLVEPMLVTDAGGTLRVEVNHEDRSSLPPSLRAETNDNRILAVAAALQAEGHDVVLVTKDLPLRLKASIAGVAAEEYREDRVAEMGWRGVTELDATADDIDRLYAHGVLDRPGHGLPCNTGVVLASGSQSALARVRADSRLHLVPPDRSMFDLRGRSAEQRLALDLLADPSVGIVSLGGPAGTGKSVLALAAGLDWVLERNAHRRVLVFRPIFAVGGQDLGFLPGSEAEKMAPWAAAVSDALESIAGPSVVEHIKAHGLLDVLPLTHIRGRSLVDTFVIIDEAQNLERNVLLSALSRLGTGSRVVLTHDIAQRDNLRVGRHDGIASVIETLRGHRLFGHVSLRRAERSEIAALVTSVLDLP